VHETLAGKSKVQLLIASRPWTRSQAERASGVAPRDCRLRPDDQRLPLQPDQEHLERPAPLAVLDDRRDAALTARQSRARRRLRLARRFYGSLGGAGAAVQVLCSSMPEIYSTTQTTTASKSPRRQALRPPTAASPPADHSRLAGDQADKDVHHAPSGRWMAGRQATRDRSHEVPAVPACCSASTRIARTDLGVAHA
jgi:hypothetical protein